MSYLSFLTDYGLADGFVAACHGVLHNRVPDLCVIDITHLIPAGDVRRGAVVLAQTVPYLPQAVHLAVVDPGVGTSRRALAVSTPRGALVGPDNGLLPPAADALGGVLSAVELPVPAGVPATFHGRDVFAPAAAALAAAGELAVLGTPVRIDELVRLPPPLARLVGPPAPGPDVPAGRDIRADGAGVIVEAEVVTVDGFGNVQLAADGPLLASAGLVPGRTAKISWGSSATTARVGLTFGSVDPGELVVYVDSSGLAALAVNRGSAAQRLAVTAGDLVRLTR